MLVKVYVSPGLSVSPVAMEDKAEDSRAKDEQLLCSRLKICEKLPARAATCWCNRCVIVASCLDADSILIVLIVAA